MDRIKTFFEQIIMFFKIGYFNPKYVLLANISNNDDDNDNEINSLLWNNAVQYYHTGDKIYDALYVAIYEYKILKKLSKENKD